MWMNLDQLPVGQSMYTVLVTDQPVGTALDDLEYDEVDVITSSRAAVAGVITAADLSDYPDCRVIGVINQSDSYVMSSTPNGDLR